MSTPAPTPEGPWRNRIVRTATVRADSLLANEGNWRIHPTHQQDAIAGVLDAVGWVQNVIVNLRSDDAWGERRGIETMVDGHARALLALREGDATPVPVVYVDLGPADEALVLASLDPLAALAGADRAQLDGLLDAAPPVTDPALAAMLDDLRAFGSPFGPTTYGGGSDSAEPRAEPAAPDAFRAVDPDAMETDHRCPRCGYEWSGGAA